MLLVIQRLSLQRNEVNHYKFNFTTEFLIFILSGWVFGLTTCNVSSIIRSDKPAVDGVCVARTDMLNAERKKQLNALK